ncbi:MAG: hypothetical protein A3F41_06960 [Coxiella sp. RIFCSPHIGHO2_12_FULL_44_14]|nr:MAG: hypothetical protein A3F41_06960 [Coxiella sp. RIFCSPHIGHO2_12_FULL_44_14]
MLRHFLSSEFDVIGMIGVALILVAYLLLQIDKLSQDSIYYSFLNLLGSALILVSLCFTLNIPSLVIEIAWLIISLFGLIKAIYFRVKKGER